MEQVKEDNRIRPRSLKGVLFLAVGLLLLGWLLHTPEGLLGKADAIGYAVCHRIDERSFHLGERQVPLCARCSGMFLGAMLGLAYQAATGCRRSEMPTWTVWVILALFVLAFGADGTNSYLTLLLGRAMLYEPNNTLRLLTGTGMGIVMAAVFFPVFNQTVWKDRDDRRALNGLRPLAGLVALGLLLDLILLTEQPIFLYPLALLSAAGILVLLTMLYCVLLLIAFRAENRIQTAAQLVLPLVGGFGMALAQVALIDWVRFWLTGTWGGFPLG